MYWLKFSFYRIFFLESNFFLNSIVFFEYYKNYLNKLFVISTLDNY